MILNDEELKDQFIIPGLMKLVLTLICGVLVFLSFILICKSLINNKPLDPNIIQLMIYNILALIVIHIPWEVFFRKIKKIGPVEFQHVFEKQIIDIVELEDRVSALEESIEKSDEMSKFADTFYKHDMMENLTSFLYENRPAAFSPLRIKEWGGKQPGYEIFGKHDISLIRRYLRKLLSEGKVSTAISKKGNVLYRIAED